MLYSQYSVILIMFVSVFQLKVREHPVLGPYVEGLSTYVVQSFDDIKVHIALLHFLVPHR